MKIAYFDMFSGVSGDMILGALVDCGFPRKKLEETVAALGLDGVRPKFGQDKTNGITATRVEVGADEKHHHRGLRERSSLIGKSALPERVKKLSLKIFRRLGEADAAVHGVKLEEIHFHEVGALDSIVDIVGAAAGFIHLGIESYYASAFRTGTGFVEFSHGRLALPVPAVARLTLGYPVVRTNVEAELTTPTGAAIVTTLVKRENFNPPRALVFQNVGYGRGSRTLQDRPNLLRLFIGEERGEEKHGVETVVLECNIDDMNPQYFDYLMEKLFAGGALDVFFTQAQMKKNRPAVVLHVLADEKDLDTLTRTVLKESTTIGLRYYRVNRITLDRRMEKISTRWGEVNVKRVELPGGGSRVKAEYGDLCKLAEKTGMPLIEIASRVDAFLNE